MSFNAVNMCRFVIAVIFASFVSYVLAATPDKPGEREYKCWLHPEVNNTRNDLKLCFNQTVARHLHPDLPKASDGECQNATDFNQKLDIYFDKLHTVCKRKEHWNTTNIKNLVEFSLRNGSFKNFYNDLSCVKRLEVNISNTCVKRKVGFFNITKVKKHTMWYDKIMVLYSENSCMINKKVRDCVEVYLSQCDVQTREYVASLYNKSDAQCSQFKKKSSVPSPKGTGAVAAPWLTTPVIVAISIGAMVLVAAIIVIIVLKCKK